MTRRHLGHDELAFLLDAERVFRQAAEHVRLYLDGEQAAIYRAAGSLRGISTLIAGLGRLEGLENKAVLGVKRARTIQ